MLRRAVQDPGVHGGEWSMAQYLYGIDKGDRRFVGLPVFPLRNFTARDLYVRRGSLIREPADLAGKRIGMYSYSASGSIWYRHFLRFAGLESVFLCLQRTGAAKGPAKPGRGAGRQQGRLVGFGRGRRHEFGRRRGPAL